MNDAQKKVSTDIINLIQLGIQAAGYVDLTYAEIQEVLDEMSKQHQPDNIREPRIISISTIDPGELLLEAAKNAPHMNADLQKATARFIDIWSQPVRMVQPVKVDLCS